MTSFLTQLNNDELKLSNTVLARFDRMEINQMIETMIRFSKKFNKQFNKEANKIMRDASKLHQEFGVYSKKKLIMEKKLSYSDPLTQVVRMVDLTVMFLLVTRATKGQKLDLNFNLLMWMISMFV